MSEIEFRENEKEDAIADIGSESELTCKMEFQKPDNVIKIAVSIRYRPKTGDDADLGFMAEIKDDYMIMDEDTCELTVDEQLDKIGSRLLQNLIDKFMEERMKEKHESNSN